MLMQVLVGVLGLVTSIAASQNEGHKIPRGWSTDWQTEQLVISSNNCTTSHVTRYSMARRRDPVFFATSSSHNFELPSIEPMNSTAGEQWEFDGISEDGTQAFVFGFYRDPNFSFFGSGNLRMYAEFVYPNGSRYAIVDYAEESIIESCPGRGTRGIWKADGWQYTFEINTDMSRTRISWENPESHGNLVMTSVAPPRYADANAWPIEGASFLTVPHFYWAEPVPVADVVVNVSIYDETIAWSGMAGHERLWGAFNWYTCLERMVVVRLHVGAYALTFLEFGSARVNDVRVGSVFLAENGKRIFGTRQTVPSDDNYVLVRKLYGGIGNTTYALSDKVTGLEIELVSPKQGKSWQFNLTHKNLAFEYNLGQGRGGSAYAGIAEGGLAGGEQFTGPAFSEIMRFPESSMLLTKNYV